MCDYLDTQKTGNLDECTKFIEQSFMNKKQKRFTTQKKKLGTNNSSSVKTLHCTALTYG
jgi:hypothetical protein